jgi:hypothetical protein
LRSCENLAVFAVGLFAEAEEGSWSGTALDRLKGGGPPGDTAADAEDAYDDAALCVFFISIWCRLSAICVELPAIALSNTDVTSGLTRR